MNDLKDKPFALIGVNTITKDAKKLKAILEQEQINWLSIANSDVINSVWNHPGTPAYYILDDKGVIQYKWVGNPGARVIDAALEKLISKVPDK